MFDVKDLEGILGATLKTPDTNPSSQIEPAPLPLEKPTYVTEKQGLILAFIEESFWRDGKIPSDDVICAELGVTPAYVAKSWKAPVFREQLLYRGISLTPDNEIPVRLTPKQLQVANALLNLADRRSEREKLKALGVSPQQYSAWRRQPAFAEYLRIRGEELFKGADSDAYTALVDLVKERDLGAVKLFLEMKKIYNPKVEVNININHFMLKIVEIITKHVTDEATLNAIAIDIESIPELGSGG